MIIINIQVKRIFSQRIIRIIRYQNPLVTFKKNNLSKLIQAK